MQLSGDSKQKCFIHMNSRKRLYCILTCFVWILQVYEQCQDGYLKVKIQAVGQTLLACRLWVCKNIPQYFSDDFRRNKWKLIAFSIFLLWGRLRLVQMYDITMSQLTYIWGHFVLQMLSSYWIALSTFIFLAHQMTIDNTNFAWSYIMLWAARSQTIASINAL